MTLSDNSLKAPSLMTLFLAIGSMISGVYAPPASGGSTFPTSSTICGSTSPQCCWVKRIYELMGQTTRASATSATDCCINLPQTRGIQGVYCTSTGSVYRIDWYDKSLYGSIPKEIGNLKDLVWLYFNYNKLTGSIPPEIGNLVNLNFLFLNENQLNGSIPSQIGNLVNLYRLWLSKNQLSNSIPSSIRNLTNLQELLSGPITPLCSTALYASNTTLTICGCSSKGSPAFLFPSTDTPEECLATGPSSPLQKRTEIFSQNIGSYKFTCNVDGNMNPFQDCLNAQAKICHPTYMNTSDRVTDCKNAVNKMAQGMSPLWQAVRRECGQWPWIDGSRGTYPSPGCNTANNNLIANAYYVAGSNYVFVTSALTNSVNTGLWSNANLSSTTI